MRGKVKEVVAISPDGKVAARFPTITEAARRMGVSSRTIFVRCKEMEKLKGYRFMFADDWSPWGDYRHSGGERRKKKYKRTSYGHSEERHRKLSEALKINKPWMYRKVKRILCADTGVIFPSRREAAEWLDVNPDHLTTSICLHHRIKGYTMVYVPEGYTG